MRGDHRASKCRFRKSECLHCGKKGHIAKVCRSKLRGVPPKRAPQWGQAHLIDEEPDEEPDAVYTLYAVRSDSTAPINTTVKINTAKLQMEVDTGASLSLISEATYSNLRRKMMPVPVLSPSTIKLRTYSGEELQVMEMMTVEVCYKTQQTQPTLGGCRG